MITTIGVRDTPLVRSPRVMQVEGIFGLAAHDPGPREWRVSLPIDERDWRIGAIVGPSGAGKTTMARALFGEALVRDVDWPTDRAIVDGFPAGMGIKEIIRLLSSVGFSSPPHWLRPFQTLSRGEQFRAQLARALAERANLVVIDEFTSSLDRTVARIASAAFAKAVRRVGRRFVAVTCHDDVIDWLDPDWILEPSIGVDGVFSWRSLRNRPTVALEVSRCDVSAWRYFKDHHYLSGEISRAAICFVALVEGRPAAFTAAIPFPHPTRPGWREHRTVCLPDFQGIGVGSGLSDYVASLFRATGRPYRSVTGHPAMIASRARSPNWWMIRAPSRARQTSASGLRRRVATRRLTASFEFVGPPDRPAAISFGLIDGRGKRA